MPSPAPLTERVAIDVTALTRPGSERGLGRYTRACLAAAHATAAAVDPIAVRVRPPGRATEFVDFFDRSARLAQRQAALFHATTPYAVAATRTPTVVSILDVIPLDVASHRQTGIKAKFFFGLSKRADAVLTLSEFSADRIAATLGYPRDRIWVSPLVPEPAFDGAEDSPRSADSAAPFALCLLDMATPDPRKRSAWAPALAKHLGHSGITLAVVGAGSDTAFAGVDNLKAYGRVSDEQLAELYRNCAAFCYFSAYEGQGLPPLEAMAAGAPVVAMSNSAVTEVVADGGVLIDEPGAAWAASTDDPAVAERAVAEIADAVRALVDDAALRRGLRERARAQVATFTAARFNAATSAAYRAAQ